MDGTGTRGAEAYDQMSQDPGLMQHPEKYSTAQWLDYNTILGNGKIASNPTSAYAKTLIDTVLPNAEMLGPQESSQESMASILRDYLLGNPQAAEQQYQLSSQYMPLYSALLRGEVSKDRTSNIGDVSRLLPQVQAIDRANQSPQEQQIRQILLNSVLGDLRLGGDLSPVQSAQVNESVRSGQIARGTSSGAGAANREAVARSLKSLDLLTQRRAAAQGVVNNENALKTNPYSAVLGSPTTTSAAQGMTAQGSNTLQPNLYAQSVWNTNSNNLATAQFNQQMLNQNNMLELMKANSNLL
jgi:hypothetical protein